MSDTPPPMTTSPAQKVDLKEIQVASDIRYIKVGSIGVGVANTTDSDYAFILTIFENQFVPKPSPEGQLEIQYVKKAVSTLSVELDMARSLHAALDRALKDIDVERAQAADDTQQSN